VVAVCRHHAQRILEILETWWSSWHGKQQQLDF
jgi:hypothetical protein